MSDALQEFLNKNSKRAEEYQEVIEGMMGDWERYGYAQSTLIGILEFIDEHNSITDNQVQAVENIRANPSKHAW